MKNSILILLLLVSASAFSQDIVGLYQPVKKSNDPQGGSVFFINEDSTWGVFAFGVAQYGRIEKLNDSLYVFSRKKPKAPFMVYSRSNKKLGDSMHIFLSDFSSIGGLIHFDTPSNSIPKAQRIFAPNANGFAYPYVAKFPVIKKQISLARSFGWEDEVYEFFNFNNSECTDFIKVKINSIWQVS